MEDPLPLSLLEKKSHKRKPQLRKGATMFVGSLEVQDHSLKDDHRMENFITNQRVSDRLKDFDPEFGDLAVRMAGEVWGRAGLSQKERAFLCIAANVCNQTLDGPYQLHIDLALKGGATPEQIREVLLHMAIYASFPKALQALRALHPYLEEKGIPLA